MNGSPDTVSPHGTAAAANEATDLDELKAYLDWLRELAAAGGALSKLVLLELRLAVGDGLRLVLLGLVMLSVVMLAWTGFSVLLAWLAYLHWQSVISGLCAFLAMQLVALGVDVVATTAIPQKPLPAGHSASSGCIYGGGQTWRAGS